MWGTNTSIKGESSLLLSLVTFPGADTFIHVLGKGVILAVAVVVGIVLAFGDGDPCLGTARENAGS